MHNRLLGKIIIKLGKLPIKSNIYKGLQSGQWSFLALAIDLLIDSELTAFRGASGTAVAAAASAAAVSICRFSLHL